MKIEASTKECRRVFPAGAGVAVLMIMLTLLIPSVSAVAQGMPATPKEKTLYQRLGGYDSIAGIVDDFIGQLGKDEAFKRFGGGRSLSSLHATRQLVVEQICNLAGGPCVYIGRPTKVAHEGLKITQEEWDSSMKKWKISLDKFKIAEPEQKDFLALIENLRKDIVEPPKDQKAKDMAPGDSADKYKN
jgi:hemoglobin